MRSPISRSTAERGASPDHPARIAVDEALSRTRRVARPFSPEDVARILDALDYTPARLAFVLGAAIIVCPLDEHWTAIFGALREQLDRRRGLRDKPFQEAASRQESGEIQRGYGLELLRERHREGVAGVLKMLFGR